jgi:hypothetical protein
MPLSFCPNYEVSLEYLATVEGVDVRPLVLRSKRF